MNNFVVMGICWALAITEVIAFSIYFCIGAAKIRKKIARMGRLIPIQLVVVQGGHPNSQIVQMVPPSPASSQYNIQMASHQPSAPGFYQPQNNDNPPSYYSAVAPSAPPK